MGPAYSIALLGVIVAFGNSGNLAAQRDPQAILGGAPVDACAWPSAARVTVGPAIQGAVLIHPRVALLTSALQRYAGPGDSYRFIFGHSGTGDLDGVADLQNCHFDGVFGVCVLNEPVDLPFAPPLFGCETTNLGVGAATTLVGFGDVGKQPNDVRRAALATVDEVLDTGIFLLDGGVGPCAGDAGSPAFLRLEDGSWRTVGIASTTGCSGVPYLTVSDRVPWVEEVTGIDVTPCHDADGFPDAGSDCAGFFAGDADNIGTWADVFCEDGPRGGSGGVCSSDELPPSVTIDAPGAGTSYPDAPSSVVVEVSADDAEGLGVRDVRLVINGEVLGSERSQPPYTFDVDLPEGIWVLRALARDWGGNEAESREVEVLVGDVMVPPTPGTGTSTGAGHPGETESGESSETTTSDGSGVPPIDTSGGTDVDGGQAEPVGGGCGVGGRSHPGLMAVLLMCGVLFTRRR
ncbi:MAG: Ig-like domain-containing protein [Nannocystales bacterium]